MRELAADLERQAEFVCECGSVECSQHLQVPVDEYERARAHGRRFILAHGHERPEFERVVAEADGWVVVEKIGDAGAVASAHNPRRA
jgi:hypothetical protein